MRPTVILLALSASLVAQPCLGQGAPPNPFASNYPSAAPSRAERALPIRRRSPPRRIEAGPVPPASIPGERGGAWR